MEPVVEIRARFADDVVAREAADALNRWFRWVLDGAPSPAPQAFEPLGVPTSEWAWTLEDDVDWTVGPHARAAGAEVRIALETHDTFARLVGLVRALGALNARILRDEPATDE